MEEMRLKTNDELARILGIKSKDVKSMPMQQILDNVSLTLRPKLKAAIELYKRKLESNDAVTIERADDVLNVIRPLLMDLDHEECWALMIDNAGHLKSKVRISTGSLRFCVIDINGVCRNALYEKAVSVILVHNHPSGCTRPSAKDIDENRRLKEALKLIDCFLLDHIIVAKGGDAYSFAEETVIKNNRV